MAFDHYEPFKYVLEHRLICCQEGNAFLSSISGQHPCGCLLTDFDDFHPLGLDLYGAECQIERQDTPEFKRLRSKIVNSLEPQYQRIVAVSQRLAEFVSNEKMTGGLFSNAFRRCGDLLVSSSFAKIHEVSSGMALLETYSKAFKYCDIPCSIEENLETLEWSFGRHPRARPAGDFVLKAFHEHSIFSFQGFREAVNDLQTQHLKIRRVRNELYKYDPAGDVDFSINIDHSPLYDKMIDWEL